MYQGLQGKKAIVPAASKGLGKAIATELARHGSSVTISSRSEENLHDAKGEIVRDTDIEGAKVGTVRCDLTDPNDIESFVAESIATMGGLDTLITNHGGLAKGDIDGVSLGGVDDAFKLGLRSTVQLVKESLPALSEDGGSISHVVAATARASPAGLFLSNTIRPGIYGLSKTVANAYGADGVRSNCVEPLLIRTTRVEDLIAERAAERGVPTAVVEADFTDDIPLDRLGTPAEFAHVVAFLASDAASFVTGTVIPVDGGWSNITF